MRDIILLGGGGHAKVLIDLITLSGQYNIIGVLDPQVEKGAFVQDTPVLGGDDLLPVLYQKGTKNACIAVGSIRDNDKRQKLYENLKSIGFYMPGLIHPGAIISSNVEISEGVQIMAGAIIQTGSRIGQNSIINTGAIVDHDCHIGDHVHICPAATISGGCTISDSAFIGAGATIIQGTRIGKGSIIGAGAVVISDVLMQTVVRGVPAK